MARYWMLDACAFLDNGEILYYRTIPSEPVELDDEVAAALGDKVRRFDPPVDPPSEEEKVAENPSEEVNEPIEEPKPKRKRKAEEEEPDGDKEL